MWRFGNWRFLLDCAFVLSFFFELFCPNLGSAAWQQQQLVRCREEGEVGAGEEAVRNGGRVKGIFST